MNIWRIIVLFIVVSTSLLISCKSDKPPETPSDTEETQLLENTYLDSLIKLDSRNPELYYQRANYYYENGVHPAALADIYSAISIDSANAKYYLLAGDLFIKMNDANKAILLMSKGINLMPENEDLYLRAIEYNYYMGNYEAGLNFANDLLVKNKYNADAYFFKGLIYKEMGESKKAISTFQTCVEQDPQYYNAYMQLGILLSNEGNSTCLQYFENALKLVPNSREAMYGKAYFLQQEGKLKEAISSYKEILTFQPKDEEVYYNIGYCYMESDSLLKAYSNFNIAAQLNPQYASAYYMKGYVSELAKNYQDAILNYQQAALLLPDNEEIAAALARVGGSN